MDPTNFVDNPFGAPARRFGDKWAFWHFAPASVPRDLVLDPVTVMALSEADQALGQLQGLGQLIFEPHLLTVPYIAREALASTRIEGTQASLAQVLQAEAEGDDPSLQNDDVAEVEAYIRATNLGWELVGKLPISQRLINAVHRELLTGVRGEERQPGELRRSPVWIGSPTDSPETAVYVPPLPEDLGDLLADWERFVNEPPTLPTLVSAALMHYQFETIHPFLDGNGRVGRLLIGLYLRQMGQLTTPLLYLSGYLESHRREYYERLQAVREKGEIQQWLQFFLTAVSRQAEDGIDRAAQLVALRERYLEALRGSRSRAVEVIPMIFANPFLTVRRVERALGVTNQAARNYVLELQGLGLVDALELRGGKGRRRYWRAAEILSILDAPPLYERRSRL